MKPLLLLLKEWVLLEGGVTVSNNWIVIYTIFFYDRRFSHTILYIHKLSHTPRILSLGACGLIYHEKPVCYLCNRCCLFFFLLELREFPQAGNLCFGKRWFEVLRNVAEDRNWEMSLAEADKWSMTIWNDDFFVCA